MTASFCLLATTQNTLTKCLQKYCLSILKNAEYHLQNEVYLMTQGSTFFPPKYYLTNDKALQIAEKRREAKGKGGKERYIHLNAEFQRRASRDKKVFLSDQCTFPATAPPEKSHVRNWRSKGPLAPLMRPTKFPEIPVSLERNTEVFRHPLL